MTETDARLSSKSSLETERIVAEVGYRLDDVAKEGGGGPGPQGAHLHLGGTIHDVTDEVHPTLIRAAIAAAHAIDIPVTGIDLMVKSPRTSDYAFIEATSDPVLPVMNLSRRPSVSFICCFPCLCPPSLGSQSDRTSEPEACPKPEGVPFARPAVDLDYLKAGLADLLNTPSPAGYTDEVVWLLCSELDRLGLEYELTRRGAVRARLPGRERLPARAVVARLDTLDGRVKAVKESGRLELVPIGMVLTGAELVGIRRHHRRGRSNRPLRLASLTQGSVASQRA